MITSPDMPSSLSTNTREQFFCKLCLILTVVAWAAVAKYPRPGGLNDRHIFLTVLKAHKFHIKVTAWLGSGAGSLPGLQTATFLMCPRPRRAESDCSLLRSFLRALIPSWGFHPYELWKAHVQITFTLEVRLQHLNLGAGGHDSVHSNDTLGNEINSTFENFLCFIGVSFIISHVNQWHVSTGPAYFSNGF